MTVVEELLEAAVTTYVLMVAGWQTGKWLFEWTRPKDKKDNSNG
jgi:hypothetical protein